MNSIPSGLPPVARSGYRQRLHPPGGAAGPTPATQRVICGVCLRARSFASLAAGHLAGALCLGLFSFPALAQDPACKDRQAVAALLAKNFGEYATSRGLDVENQRMVEMFTNPATGTWTLIATAPNQQACFVAGGGAYEALAPARPGDPL